MSALVAGRLVDAGYPLPEPPAALGAYIPAVRTGKLVYTAGQLPIRDGKLITKGHVGTEVSMETARHCAGLAALNAIAAVATVADLDTVVRVVRLTGYVASAPGFTSQPGVIDGASAVMAAAFAEAGRHTRLAIGVAELPLGTPVLVEIIVELA
jgi:enamine deaminase RidA (YjgF/YER057c/UK114 family)